MFNSQQHYPNVIMPVFDISGLHLIDDSKYDSFHFVPVHFSLRHRWPVVVTFVEIVPVHLVHSHREHFFVFAIHSLLNHAVVEHLVDVDRGSMAVVEY